MKPPVIAVFTKNRTNAAYEGARVGADRVAAQFGARTVHYVPESPDDPIEQSALIERAIEERPDAIVLVPVHQSEIDGSILKIDAAGIPFVNLISETLVGNRVCFVGSDDFALASEVARYAVRGLKAGARILILEGTPASGTTRARTRGMRAGLGDATSCDLIASVRGDYQQNIARDAVSTLLANGARFDAVIAANDAMALGAIEAFDAAREPLPRVVGVNAVPEAIAAIKEGRMLATADFDAMKMACIATEAALRHLRGEALPARIMLPVQVVDASNCANWDRPYAERDCPTWLEVMSRQT